MAALGRLSKTRHVAVGVAIAGTSALAAFGVIGDGNPEERFDTWQTIVEPAGGDALRITETFDQDFGDDKRHGPQREIPNDFGAPTDVEASSPDAPADVNVIDGGFETIIRIGDPEVNVTGQHRYVLSYTLPESQLERGFLAIDVIAGDEFETDYAEAVVRGFELADHHCFVGFNGATTECELEQGDGFYRATFEPLPKFTGITIDGVIVDTIDPVDIEPPPLPDRRNDYSLELAIAIAVLGVLGAGAVYVWARRRGRNEVFAGGAADAAFGDLPPPNPDGSPRAGVATRLVSDDNLDDLATIEFVPPKGLRPWEGAVLLEEKLDDGAVQAWLSGLAAEEAIEIDDSDDKVRIGSGRRRTELDSVDAALLDGLIGRDGPYQTGTYDPEFAAAWRNVAAMQKQRVADSGWWKHTSPGSPLKGAGSASLGLILLGVFGAISAKVAGSVFSAFSSWPAALLFGLLFPALIAYFAYNAMLPARSAQGSALALRTESFRRFLHASEAQHVEWAWKHDLLREYSGWAVALGEADAWADALAKANIPEPARISAMPAILAATSPSITSSRVSPSKSGGSGGGTGGGSVGGGGGGGGRGSW
jgi:uncharacterized protein (TIGR04222 family)